MIPYQNPSIYPFGIRIDEPVTTLTDFLFTAVCVFAFVKTKHLSGNKGVNLYRWFFLLTGLSAFVSAVIGHAFLYYFGFEAKIYGWVTGILSASFAQFAALHHTRSSIGLKAFKLLQLANYLEIVFVTVLLFKVFSFVVVEIHTAYALVLNVVILESIHYKKTGSPLSKHMLIGVGIAVLAVFCHIFKLAISEWFNHLDLSHIFMCIGVYVMYRGVKHFKANEIQ